MLIPRGHGGGSSSHVPRESQDSLVAESYATIVDAYSEGECVGLCDRAWNPIISKSELGKGIFLNRTPLMNDDGSVNFERVYVAQVFGTQSQSYLPGADIVSSTIPDGRELKFSVPRVIPITVGENSADRISIAFSFPQQFVQQTDGDIRPIDQAVQIRIAVQLNSETAYIDQTLSVRGKASSEYVKEVIVKLPRSSNPAKDSWIITCTRLTPDSHTFSLKNTSFISYYSKITDSKLRYPNTAAVMIHGDAKQFTTLPVRGYRVKLLKVQVPSNYFPDTRKYTRSAHGGGGFSIGDDTNIVQDWDGTFYTAWTNNPAWVFYDMLTNQRYGLGGKISLENVDKWTLYDIANYCDELVDDGRGFKEPRFVCNVYFQARQGAYKVMNDLASVFRAMIYFASGTVVCAQDSKKIGPYLYSFANANVKDGMFNYSGTNDETRHTSALIRWNDPDDFYNIKYEEVQDTEGIIRYGVNVIEVAAFGCTSRGQAHRLGKWILFTELYETEIISFTTVLEGMYLRPGDIIPVYDQFRSGKRYGGRILSINEDRDEVTIDSSLTITADQITSTSGGFATVTQGENIVVANDLSTDWSSIGNGAVFYIDGETIIYRIEEAVKNEDGFWTFRLNKPWESASGSAYNHHIGPMSAIFIAPTSFAYPGEDIGSSANIPTIRPGQLIERGITNALSEGDVNILSLSHPLPEEVAVGSVWSVEDKTIQAQLFRVLGISESNTYEHNVSAVAYQPSKFDVVENNLRFVARNIKPLPDYGRVLAPNNPKATQGLIVRPEGYKSGIDLSWQAPPDSTVIGYGIVVRKDKGNWKFVNETGTTSYEFDFGSIPGEYEFQIYAYNALQRHSSFAYCSIIIKDVVHSKDGSGKITFRPTGLEISGQGNNNTYVGRDVKFDWRLNSVSTAQEIGSEVWGASSGGFDPSFDYFEISLWNADTNLIVWRKAVGKALSYNLAYNENVEAFGHAQHDYIFQVVGVDKYNNISVPARIRVTNSQPGAPSTLQSTVSFQDAFYTWANSTDRDIAYTQFYLASVNVGATAPSFGSAVAVKKVSWPLNSGSLTGLSNEKTHYVWISHVDTFGTESAIIGPNIVNTNTLKGTDVVPVFVNVLDGDSVLQTRKYTDEDDLSYSVRAPAGKKVRYEGGTDKPVSKLSPYWPNASNTGDGIGPSDFLGLIVNYVAGNDHSHFTGRISACIVDGPDGDILSEEISIVLTNVPVDLLPLPVAPQPAIIFSSGIRGTSGYKVRIVSALSGPFIIKWSDSGGVAFSDYDPNGNYEVGGILLPTSNIGEIALGVDYPVMAYVVKVGYAPSAVVPFYNTVIDPGWSDPGWGGPPGTYPP